MRMAFYLVYCAGASYLLAEAAYSLLYRNGVIDPPRFWIVEDNGVGAVQFDPHTGYRIRGEPARQAHVVGGYVDYVGGYYGNNAGFPDRDDFTPERRHPDEVRLAVFGDSFTAASFLETNWPDAVEARCGSVGSQIQLMNFALDGAGLANWWGAMTHILEAEDYELDGLVFAIYPGDLYRTLQVADQTDREAHRAWFTDSWAPEDWPKSLEEALPKMNILGPVYPTEQFDRVLSGEFYPPLPRPWKRYLADTVPRKVKDAWKRLSTEPPEPWKPPKPEDSFSPEQRRLMNDWIRFVETRRLPVLVIRIPDRAESMQAAKEGPGRCLPTAFGGKRYLPGAEAFERTGRADAAFAAMMGGHYADGRDAYAGMTARRIRKKYFRYDGHWNQDGSLLFAIRAKALLDQWLDEVRAHPDTDLAGGGKTP